jgi:hypothetical protein
MDKKTKRIIIFVLLAVALVIGFRQLNLQSVSDYKKEQTKVAKDLQLTPVKTSGATEEHSEKTAPSSKDPDQKTSGKDQKKAAKKSSKKESNKDSKEHSKKNSSKHTNNYTNKKSNKDNKDHTNKNAKKQTNVDQKKDSSKGKHRKNTSQKDTTSKQEKEDEKEDEKKLIQCTISIICPVLADDPSAMQEAYRNYIPGDGVLLETSTVTIKEGSSVFDLLKAVCQAKDIRLDAEYSSLYSGSYVRGIGHLYERRAGDMSGWLYKVNGVIPQKGASSYKLKDNDNVVWGYTINGRGM